MPKSSKQKLAFQQAYNAQPEQKKKRAANNAARRKAIREGRVSKGDGKDVAHVVALSKGGTNEDGNLRVQSRKKNRGWRRGESGYDV